MAARDLAKWSEKADKDAVQRQDAIGMTTYGGRRPVKKDAETDS